MVNLGYHMEVDKYSAVNIGAIGANDKQDSNFADNHWTGGKFPVIDYFQDQLRSFFSHGATFFLSILLGGGLWENMKHQFDGFWLTDAVFWLPTLWLISFTCGGLWALKENRWQRQKAIHAIWKLVGYCMFLIIAHGFRHFSVIGGYPAGLIEVACIFVEGYNALENAAGLTGMEWLKRFIRSSKENVGNSILRLVGAEIEQVKTEIQDVKAQQTVILEQVQQVASNPPQIQVNTERLEVKITEKAEDNQSTTKKE